MIIMYNKSGKITGSIRTVIDMSEKEILEMLDADDSYINISESIDITRFSVNVKTKKLEELPKNTAPDIVTIIRNAKLPDSQLNNSINEYISANGIKSSIDQWRIDNYINLRQCAYPDNNDYLDAQVKLSSTDPDIIAEGQAQLDKYYADCLAVKARFPKE